MENQIGIGEVRKKFMNIKNKFNSSKQLSLIIDDRRGYKVSGANPIFYHNDEVNKFLLKINFINHYNLI